MIFRVFFRQTANKQTKPSVKKSTEYIASIYGVTNNKKQLKKTV